MVEPGEVVAGTKLDRGMAEQVTVCDLIANATQDTAIALHAAGAMPA